MKILLIIYLLSVVVVGIFSVVVLCSDWDEGRDIYLQDLVEAFGSTLIPIANTFVVACLITEYLCNNPVVIKGKKQ